MCLQISQLCLVEPAFTTASQPAPLLHLQHRTADSLAAAVQKVRCASKSGNCSDAVHQADVSAVAAVASAQAASASDSFTQAYMYETLHVRMYMKQHVKLLCRSICTSFGLGSSLVLFNSAQSPQLLLHLLLHGDLSYLWLPRSVRWLEVLCRSKCSNGCDICLLSLMVLTTHCFVTCKCGCQSDCVQDSITDQ